MHGFDGALRLNVDFHSVVLVDVNSDKDVTVLRAVLKDKKLDATVDDLLVEIAEKDQ